jgi:ketosteroid isomerase-like protein
MTPIRRRSLMLASALPLGAPGLAQTPPAAPAPGPAWPPVAALSGPDATGLRDAELAFADSMARRDRAAFALWIAEDAVFLNGGDVQRGKAAIVAQWSRLFDGPEAPFAWAPDLVAVLDNGLLGYTNGPVRNRSGRVFSRFHSTWRREGPGAPWRVVFDNGQAVAPPAAGG